MTDLARVRSRIWIFLAALMLAMTASVAMAHNVTEGDAGYVQEVSGFLPIPFIYLGAKHMVTGYDHILFLFGVVFFLYRSRDIGLYVSLFAIGHSVTMLTGVWFGIKINPYIIDAIIGFSVVYKAMDNLGAFKRWFGFQPDTRAATLIFGLLHGFGLATKILDYDIAPNGLLGNLIAFKIGVELGQLLALSLILIAMGFWRRSPRFWGQAYTANVVMMSAGFLLVFYQLTGLVLS
ncbi:HupE/UreJ family protein [Xinfangfangia sp. D13-10-4-6]|uniref:HupE/UreJ family protein n=1 Tax=Pseudogemmobacter hezensis TaxID=2737662 RepID=UPI001557664F|nr:HupE/UreJ family protein [Pseudogemmobacter hezensis]NPD15139.1 HupE/UreJ family protein [Pseudogemmobacter hezensis]